MRPFNCRISGPVEFRNLHVTNNSGRGYIPGKSNVYWQVKIAGRVVSGKARLWTPVSAGDTLVIPLKHGGQGNCQARIGR